MPRALALAVLAAAVLAGCGALSSPDVRIERTPLGILVWCLPHERSGQCTGDLDREAQLAEIRRLLALYERAAPATAP